MWAEIMLLCAVRRERGPTSDAEMAGQLVCGYVRVPRITSDG